MKKYFNDPRPTTVRTRLFFLNEAPPSKKESQPITGLQMENSIVYSVEAIESHSIFLHRHFKTLVITGVWLLLTFFNNT